MSLKEQIINKIIEIEGGYVDDSYDSGGKTRYGITVNIARKNGYKGDMKDLPLGLAKNIYIKKYWDSLNLDKIEKLSAVITEELVDTGINLGINKAAKFLQRSLNVLNNNQKYYSDIIVDGNIGSKTINSLKKFLSVRGKKGENILFNMLNCLQGNFYIQLAEKRKKDEKFIYGWFLNRIN